MAYFPRTTRRRSRRNAQTIGAVLLVMSFVTAACSSSSSRTDGGIPSLLPSESAEEVDRVLEQATPIPTPVADTPVDEVEADSVTATTAATPAEPTGVPTPTPIAIPTTEESKTQPVFRQAQADDDGPDNPTQFSLAPDEPVDVVGELSTFIDRIDVISVDGAPPGQPVVVAWRCVAFASADNRPLLVTIVGDGEQLGQGQCTEVGQQRSLQVAGPEDGPILVIFDITPSDAASDANMFVEYQLVVGGDAAELAAGPFQVRPNDQRAADDGDSRENPQGRDANGILGGEISGPFGDSSDWSTFEFDEDIAERVRGGISCTDFISSDGSAVVTATIYRGNDVGVSFVCTPDAPVSKRALRFDPGVTYFVNVEFAGTGYVRWIFETSDL